MKKTVQTFEITIPSASAAGTPFNIEEQFRTDYTRCSGFCLHVVDNANNEKANVRIELDDGNILTEHVHYEHIEANAATPVSDRFHPADFISASKKVRITATPLVLTTADITLQFVFRLEK